MRNAERHKPDQILLAAVVLLLVLGIFMVYSASSFRAEVQQDDSTYFLKRHSIRVVLGLLGLILFMRMDYKKLRWFSLLMFAGCLAGLFLVLSLPEYHGVHRSFILWKFRIQPSEFMKLGLIFYFAAIFSKGAEAKIHKQSIFIAHYAILLLIVGLVFIEPDLGTAMVLFAIGVALFYLGGIHWKRLFWVGISALGFVGIGVATRAYQRERLVDFVKSVMGKGEMSYHVKQAVIGLAYGGFGGVGYGAGKQKLLFLPEPFNDFILGAIGEELGFIGIALIFTLISIILWRGIHITLHTSDRYGFLLAGGITSMILINALINAGVVVNLLPTTGLPFPFISYGGSSLLAHLMGVGVLLNISTQSGISYREYTNHRARKKSSKKSREAW